MLSTEGSSNNSFPSGKITQTMSLKSYFPPKTDIKHSITQNPGKLIQTVEDSMQPSSKKSVDDILEDVSLLSDTEKLLLYLRLPTGKILQDPLQLPENPLGNRPEIGLTITWIKTHLKENQRFSLPKQDVYNEYTRCCLLKCVKPLSNADFGKVMKQVYPNVRPRRLGTRGHSRYCYSGLIARNHLMFPVLPLVNDEEEPRESSGVKAAELRFLMNTKIVKPSRASENSSIHSKQNEVSTFNQFKVPAAKKPRKILPANGMNEFKQLDQSKAGPSGLGKLPIPRLRLTNSKSPVVPVKKQKHLQPKPKVFESKLETRSSISEVQPKTSHLRMLLERSKEETKENKSKAQDFLPISPFKIPKPVSSPNKTRPKSVASNTSTILKSALQKDHIEEDPFRCQSVQINQLNETPGYFYIDTNSSNFIEIDSFNSTTEDKPIVDNLNNIINIINEMDVSKLSSYQNTTYDPIVSGFSFNGYETKIPGIESLQTPFLPLLEGTFNLYEDGLTICDDSSAITDLVCEAQLDSDII